jgi:hypothetical protein
MEEHVELSSTTGSRTSLPARCASRTPRSVLWKPIFSKAHWRTERPPSAPAFGHYRVPVRITLQTGWNDAILATRGSSGAPPTNALCFHPVKVMMCKCALTNAVCSCRGQFGVCTRILDESDWMRVLHAKRWRERSGSWYQLAYHRTDNFRGDTCFKTEPAVEGAFRCAGACGAVSPRRHPGAHLCHGSYSTVLLAARRVL